MAKTEDLRSLTTHELSARLEDTQEELMNLRFQHATGELKDFTRLRHTRRQIARLMTFLHEKQKATMGGEA